MSVIDVKVPDIGDYKNVPIIEVHVKPGDAIRRDDPLITLESDKAAMEVPAPDAGKVAEVLVKVGDKVSQGTAIVRLASETAGASAEARAAEPKASTASPEKAPAGTKASEPSAQVVDQTPAAATGIAPRVPLPIGSDFGGVHASPSVRRIARELDIDLTQLTGSGEKAASRRRTSSGR
jgi:pyruvate dehydrogenase E2 component (dihydrolipoamide acetyltransferase)